MGDQAVEFIDGVRPGKPFCLSVSFKAPHRQDADPCEFLYPPDLARMYREVTIPLPRLSDPAFFDALPDFFDDCENRRRWKVHFGSPELVQHSVKAYYRLISGVDRVVGRIMDKLDERNLGQDTIVIYTSDNGFYLGDRGLSAKAFPHDVSIRVPLVIYDPRLPARRRPKRCDKIVLNVDLAPTILKMAGLEVPDAMQGKSLVPLVEGRNVDWRTEFYYEELCELESVFIPRSVAVRNQRFKYMRFIDADPLYEELYDLSSDTAEEHNLVDKPKHAKTLEQMRRTCESWRERVK
jgi:arylsulfatase A-like enzyme